MSKDKKAQTVFAVMEAQNCCEADAMWPVALFTEESVADTYMNGHSMSMELYKYELKLDPWVEYLKAGKVPYELILSQHGELQDFRRLDFNRLQYHGRWAIVNQGISIQVVVSEPLEAMIKASRILESLIEKGRIK